MRTALADRFTDTDRLYRVIGQQDDLLVAVIRDLAAIGHAKASKYAAQLGELRRQVPLTTVIEVTRCK